MSDSLERQGAARGGLSWRAYIVLLWQVHRRGLIISGLTLAFLFALAWAPPNTLARLVTGLIERRSLVGMLLFFGLLSLSLLWSAGQRLDGWVFLRINVYGPHPPALDRLMGLATQLGNFATAVALAALALLSNHWRLAVEILLGVISLWLIVETIKALAARSRPYWRFAEARIIGWREPGQSFPSGHTSQSFFLASLLAHYFQLNLGASVLVYGLAALVGFTRMYVGAHYPRDVLGGFIAGWVWGTVAALADRSWAPR